MRKNAVVQYHPQNIVNIELFLNYIMLYHNVVRIYSSVVPSVVNITDVSCEPRNLINQCNVGWNVSV